MTLLSLSRAVGQAKSTESHFDLAAFIKANNLSTDLSTWFAADFNFAPADGSADETSSEHGFFDVFEVTAGNNEQLFMDIIQGCILRGLTLPVLSKRSYSHLEIYNCSFKALALNATLLIQFCTLTNVSISDTDIRFVKISNAPAISNLECYDLTLDELVLASSNLAGTVNIRNCSIQTARFMEVNAAENIQLTHNRLTDCFVLISNIFRAGFDPRPLLNSNTFAKLHGIYNVDNGEVDDKLNRTKIEAAKEYNATIAVIPNVLVAGENAKKLLKFYLDRGSYRTPDERRKLIFVIFINCISEFDERAKYYLDQAHLCVLPGGANIPHEMYTQVVAGHATINSFVRNGYYDISLFSDPKFNSRFIAPGEKGRELLRSVFELKLLDYLKDKDVKVVGICRGMQIMGVWAGAKVIDMANQHSSENDGHMYFYSDLPTTCALVEMINTKYARRKQYIRDTIKIPINCQHTQQIQLPEGTKTAITPLCYKTVAGETVIEAVQFENNPTWCAFQNHMESIADNGSESYSTLDVRYAEAIIRHLMLPERSRGRRRASVDSLALSEYTASERSESVSELAFSPRSSSLLFSPASTTSTTPISASPYGVVVDDDTTVASAVDELAQLKFTKNISATSAAPIVKPKPHGFIS